MWQLFYCHDLTNLAWLSGNCFSVFVTFLWTLSFMHCADSSVSRLLPDFLILTLASVAAATVWLIGSNSAKKHSWTTFFCLCITVIPEIPHIAQVEFVNSSAEAVLQWKTSESSVHLRPYIRLRTGNGRWVTWRCHIWGISLQPAVCQWNSSDWCFLGRKGGSRPRWRCDKSGRAEAPDWIYFPDENM